MRNLLYNILFVLSIQAPLCSQVSSGNVHNDLATFFANSVRGDILRNHSIQFTFVNRNLDTSNTKTIQFLDSLASYLVEYGNSIEIGTHISIKYSNSSSRNYDNMPNEILNYLVSKGVRKEQLIVQNYLDRSPILSLSEKTKFNTEREFWEAEWKTNNRVEFKMITN